LAVTSWARRCTCANITSRTSSPASCTELLETETSRRRNLSLAIWARCRAPLCHARPARGRWGCNDAVRGSTADHTIAPDGTCSEQGNELVAQSQAARSLRAWDFRRAATSGASSKI
jgi:hypothetical protein